MKMYLPLTKKRKRRIEDTTYAGYYEKVRYPIEPYFRKRKIRLKDLTAQDIQDFYDEQLNISTAVDCMFEYWKSGNYLF